MAHEILHSLGFWHEQMRPDRDSAVYINLANVTPSMRYNFNTIARSKWNSFGQPYDIKVSVIFEFLFVSQEIITVLNSKSIV